MTANDSYRAKACGRVSAITRRAAGFLLPPSRSQRFGRCGRKECAMENVWLASAVWLGLALLASIISIRVAMSIALVEIVVGAVAGNVIGLHLTEWVNFLAGFGAILLTFLAGTEIDNRVVRKHFWSSITIGVVGFLAPYVGVLMYAMQSAGHGPRLRSPAFRCQPPRSQSSMP